MNTVLFNFIICIAIIDIHVLFWNIQNKVKLAKINTFLLIFIIRTVIIRLHILYWNTQNIRWTSSHLILLFVLLSLTCTSFFQIPRTKMNFFLNMRELTALSSKNSFIRTSLFPQLVHITEVLLCLYLQSYLTQALWFIHSLCLIHTDSDLLQD